MKKVYKINDLECAHCAAKMEAEIAKLEGVEQVSVNFFAQKLTLQAEDALVDSLAVQAAKICRKIEPDCEVVLK